MENFVHVVILLLLSTKLYLQADALACDKGEWQCGSGQCISLSWKCDGEEDCVDNSDEASCSKLPTKKCSDSEFACKNGRRCIPKAWTCDKANDCGDNSDESTTDGPKCTAKCPSTDFQCNISKVCLDKARKCDGRKDCGANDDSDEIGCVTTCSEDEFTCGDGSCISKSWHCDGENDCADGADEKGCAKIRCPYSYQFRCGYHGSCIYKSWTCNGYEDCTDGSDEDEALCKPKCGANEFKCGDNKCIDAKFKCNKIAECTDKSDEKDCNTQQCSSTQFKCVWSGHCIDKTIWCDGKSDCVDGSDEQRCPLTTKMTTTRKTTKGSTTPKKCVDNHFKCTKSGKCVHNSWLCDGERDCADGEDEAKELCEKRTCNPTQFACKNGKCILGHLKCDGMNDCGDSSDEQDCPTLKPIECTGEAFKCGNTSKCINMLQVCDAKRDCEGGEDEPAECGKNECQDGSHSCSQNCFDQKIGYKCTCNKGFQLALDNKTCVNINECHQLGQCSQKCVDFKGSFKCLCNDGYRLDGDMRTCRASGSLAELVIGMRSDIRQLRADGQHYKAVVHASFVEVVMSLDVDVQGQYVYFADMGNKSIARASLKSSDHFVHLVRNVEKPEGIAYDWISNKVYWTATHPKYQGVIEVSNADGTSRSVLVFKKVDEPRAIAVHPLKRLLFWTDWGSRPRIERVSMDGLQRQVIVNSEHVTWPNGLAVDYEANRLYWADSKRNNIGACNLDGTGLFIAVKDVPNPYGLTVFEDSVYWTNYRQGQVFRANKFNGANKYEYQDGFFAPMDVQVMHPLLQRQVSNPCASNNGGCSHLCLLSSVKKEGYSCACPTDIKMFPDGKTCDVVYPTTTKVLTTNQRLQTTSSTGAKGCHDHEYFCQKSKVCVSQTKLCDGVSDCPLNEDEELDRCNSVELAASKKKKSSSSTPLIAGVLAGIAFIVLLIVLVVLLVFKRRRNQANLSITFHPSDPEKLAVQTVKFSPNGTHKKSANKNFENINYAPASETEELIPDPGLMNVPDDSSSDNGSTCDETKPVMNHQESNSSNSLEC
ncbi:low-density lipoprotein receptor-related protein 4-like isoform X3 [Rhopilema esculentum]|uniref:low-density lipoprotein receptor-related protein 4-like isoform X3 n=1 Tax=Rhopilema esculentum TaxID=499914 RepID=UPI0031CDB99E